MSVSALHATSSRRIGSIARAVVSAALAATLVSGNVGAQPPDPDRSENEAKTARPSTGEVVRSKPTAAESKPVGPVKRPTKPFVPTDRIDAESVVAFPANI